MSQNVEISRVNWTDPIQRKHFIDLCLQKANKGFSSGGGLKSLVLGLELLKSWRSYLENVILQNNLRMGGIT